MKTKAAVALMFAVVFSLPLCAAAVEPFDDLRGKQAEIRAFMEAMIKRRLAMEVANVMAERGFRDEQIAEVLRERSFHAFAERVVKNRGVDQSLTALLNRVLAPGALETALKKREYERNAAGKEATILAVQEILRSRQLRANAFSAEEKKPFWNRLWEKLKRDLLG